MSRGGPNERLLGRAAGWSLLSLRVFANSIAVFTGLVEDVGQLLSRTPRGPGARLRVATRLSPLVLGESIAVMGVCLTVQRILDGAFEADASGETLVRSTLGRLPVGHGLHLERAVAVGGRFGGHIVAGHVDGLGRLVEKRPLGEAVDLAFSYDGHLAALLAEKGSVAVDGVSLTINAVDAKVFHVAVIPHTQEKTLLEKMSVGMEVNLEADVLARYVARWLEVGRSAAGSGGTTDDSLLSRLASSGFL
ncbi:MAG TPA: riboflavin synthase [Polyangiaceae bacterium]|nr:riboflavin synthase [Polyangiaceae bacterium]HNZ21166.1 riboflavin synthase [Polyangiaceae bacterium]HOD23696.1 riboflavin synthase [Polyangiaceae bacterium]HOE48088.1 riboflavin synthase [Polyangiaceae bacterium]HOG99347.1 riboflavin synthase [Polyangiaceae bacterium]